MDQADSRCGAPSRRQVSTPARAKLIRLLAVAVLIIGRRSAGSIAAQEQIETAPYAPDRIVVKLRDEASPDGRQAADGTLAELSAKYKVRSVKPLFPGFSENVRRLRSLADRSDSQLNRLEKRLKRRLERVPGNRPVPALDRVYLLEVDPAGPEGPDDMARTLASHPAVEYAEPDYYVSLCATPNDPLYSDQWALRQLDAPAAWDITTGSADIVVAVIDTGVYEHPDILDNMWVNEAEFNGSEGVDDDGNGYVDDIHGYDFANEDGQPIDDYGHGTHIAGIIAASGSNDMDMTGICWDCRIMAIKMIDPDTLGPVSRASVAIAYAVNNGADILSNSWGMNPPSEFLKDAFDYAYSMGVISVAAAGNDATSRVFYPAGYEHVIGVAATNEGGSRAYFSNYGNWVDIGAPGTNILSLYFNFTRTWQGTSMACPHVAGACALLLSANPYLTPDDVRDTIMSNADSTSAGTSRYNGRLNLHKALQGAIPVNGYVRLDAASYSAHDRIAISVADADLAGQASQDVTIATDRGDSEIVSLAESSVAGVFLGEAPTGSDPVAAGDGIIQLADGDNIVVTYHDEHALSRGGQATLTDSAIADCQAPVLTAIDVLDTGPAPVISFDTDERVTAAVLWYASVDSDELIRTKSAGSSTSHTVTLQGVRSETAYILTVELTDRVGNVTVADNAGQGFTFTTDPDLGDLVVPTDYATIQDAVDHCWDGRIVWVADGLYTGPGNRDIILPARQISVRSVNGPEACIIDCQGSESDMHRAFYLRERQSRACAIEGFTITGGYQHADNTNGILCKGAGILCNGASPTIRGCVFTQNSTSWVGSGICCTNGSAPLIEQCSFLNNDTINRGAAIASIEASEPNIVNCQFTGNTAYFGGAIYAETSNVHIEESTFIDNYSQSMGGAVFGGLSVQIRNCSFFGNRADYGGGALADGEASTVVNCLFVGNTAADCGGAICEQGDSALTLLHCTFADSEAVDGGTVALQHATGDPLVFHAANCIFWDGPGWLWYEEPIAPVVSYSAVEGGWPGVGNLDSDPAFVAPESGDYHLTPGSPCIDAGTLDIGDLPAYDLDGAPRPVDGDNDGMSIPDMGAYEYQPPRGGFVQ